MAGFTHDVCIIGSGVAGALVAHELVQRGRKVLILDAGRRFDPTLRMELMERAVEGLDPWAPVDPDPEVYSSTGTDHVRLEGKRMRAVGGSTHHWGGLAYRMHASDFRLRSLYGLGEDWPVSYDELEPYYARAEAELGVSGQGGDPHASWRSGPFPNPAFPFSYAVEKVVRPACDHLGISIHPIPCARNSQPYRDRPACVAFGVCHVCPIEALYNADIHLRRGVATGNLEIRPEARVVRLAARSPRRVTSATYLQPGGGTGTVEAPIFVLAAHAIESIRLLQLSASPRFPGGLANSSGTLGRYFMEHWATGLAGVVEEPLYPHRIGFNTAHSLQFYDTPHRRRIGAMKITFSAGSPSLSELARDSGLWGVALKRYLRRVYGRWLAAIVNVEQLPRLESRVTLDPELRDAHGYAAPRVHLELGDYELRTLLRGRERLLRILRAARARIPGHQMAKFKDSERHPIAHHMGGCRMGIDPAGSVVDPDLRTHDLDNLYIVGSAVFPTGGAVNPTLTIAALALRAGETLAARLEGRLP